MIGIVTGLEVLSYRLSHQVARTTAEYRARLAYHAAGINLRWARTKTRTFYALNQDALIAQVSIDSSAWTGR